MARAIKEVKEGFFSSFWFYPCSSYCFLSFFDFFFLGSKEKIKTKRGKWWTELREQVPIPFPFLLPLLILTIIFVNNSIIRSEGMQQL